jgi:hypothetical protein
MPRRPVARTKVRPRPLFLELLEERTPATDVRSLAGAVAHLTPPPPNYHGGRPARAADA